MTPQANKCLRDIRHFVPGQLKHYGVEYDPSQLKGNGTLLFKKLLAEGKFDKVPDHIQQLRYDMHMEWLAGLTLDEIAQEPQFAMERFFLDASGNPDKTKTTTVVGLPLPRRRIGVETKTIFLGWDQAAVQKAANGHAAKEADQRKAKRREREDDREAMHAEYRASIQKRGKGVKQRNSPVGSYIVDCPEIEQNWPRSSSDLTMDISESDEPSVYEAAFDFGVLEGIMILSTQQAALNRYCAKYDDGEEDDDSDEEEDDDDDSENEDEDEEVEQVNNTKRKAGRPRGRPPKKAKVKAKAPAAPGRTSRTFHCMWRGRETGEGEIIHDPEEGTIKFNKSGDFASFTAEVDLGFVGRGVELSARKVAAAPSRHDSWTEYSASAYECEQTDRWH
ncbi:AT hook motif family protein [Xylariaceae sp. FL0804]|nr:AT hook motif family protein [Xylariaceae sp. FL0804]